MRTGTCEFPLKISKNAPGYPRGGRAELRGSQEGCEACGSRLIGRLDCGHVALMGLRAKLFGDGTPAGIMAWAAAPTHSASLLILEACARQRVACCTTVGG
jgi:hypothetical protein